jgi:hypothetical protein
MSIRLITKLQLCYLLKTEYKIANDGAFIKYETCQQIEDVVINYFNICYILQNTL